jgi:histidine triad (HIT) family protein
MPANGPTIFDKILAGEIPSHTVYEDEQVYSFLDIGPVARGHTLVIPRERAVYLHELSDDAAAAIGRVLPRIARAVMHATGAENYNILQNNGAPAHQAVPHVHFHVIPKLGDSGLGVGWPAGSLEDDDAAALLAKMRESLGRE